MCGKVGLMPQARQGGRGVWAFAVDGSKFDGTGFEKLQMVQTQVAVAEGGVSGGGIRIGLPVLCDGDAPSLPKTSPGDRGCREERFVALGISVILADDLRNPAYVEM